MVKYSKVVLIGSGNVATVLGRMIVQAGHSVIQVCGRNAVASRMLADELHSESVIDFTHISLLADIYIVAVTDNAVAEVAAALHLPGKIVVHTTGSVSKNILQQTSDSYGVLYPLQSLRKENNLQPLVPLLVDGSDEDVCDKIALFANSLSTIVHFAYDEERFKLHIGAVFSSNFTNHLYSLTDFFCKEEAIDFSLLIPLIIETALRLKNNVPSCMQTGPAVRRDHESIQKHLTFLNKYPELKEIYSLLTESIIGVVLQNKADANQEKIKK